MEQLKEYIKELLIKDVTIDVLRVQGAAAITPTFITAVRTHSKTLNIPGIGARGVGMIQAGTLVGACIDELVKSTPKLVATPSAMHPLPPASPAPPIPTPAPKTPAPPVPKTPAPAPVLAIAITPTPTPKVKPQTVYVDEMTNDIDTLMISFNGYQSQLSNIDDMPPDVIPMDDIKTATVDTFLSKDFIRSPQILGRNTRSMDLIPLTLYYTLLHQVYKFTGSNIVALMKRIYKNRIGITSHPALTEDIKRKAWLQAYYNALTYTPSSDPAPPALPPRTAFGKTFQQPIPLSEAEAIDVWRNILSSRHAYEIMMNSHTAVAMFEKALEQFITYTPSNIRLMATVLYPISFLFLPLMFGALDFVYERMMRPVTHATSRVYISKSFTRALASPTVTNYNAMAWCYYLLNTPSDGVNPILRILHHEINQQSKTVEVEADVAE